jgi:glucose/arabinose dehydrogenase
MTVSSTSYSTVSLDITAPSDAVKAVVYVWKNAGSGLAYVDDNVFGVAPGSAPPPPPSGNLIANGGFESGLASWDNWGNASTSTAQAAAGSFAAQVGTGAGGLGQTVGGVLAGKTYRVGALAKVSSADEVGYLGVRFTDDAGTRLLEQNVTFSSTAYTTAQLDIVAPANATKALVYVWKNAGSGFAYVDQVSLTQAAGSNSVTLIPVVSGLASPIDLQATDDSTGRLFVVEQPGTIRILQAGALLPTPFLDIRTRVTFSGEMGLLGAAFHPAFAQNQRFYVNYVRVLGTGEIQSVIAEYRVSAADPNQADPASERILLTVNQPFETHKAGQLAFGPDGFLYIALGDGGGAGDTQGSGQNLQTLLGKMLRIDVDRTAGAQPYAIPADNPFVAGGGLPEIWASGLRNPFRFSFDTATGRLFVGDVGQRLYEEIDILQKGGNYGWNVMEGMHCFNPATGCNQAGLTLPIAEYDHSEGVAVIGGYVYRGEGIPALAGSYVFGDFGSGNIWRLTQDSSGAWQRVLLLNSGRNMSSFGRDSAGELYLVDYAAGEILKLSP